MGKQGAEENDYHSELMRLRQRWRLKRAGNMITGDLTYHSGWTAWCIEQTNLWFLKQVKNINLQHCHKYIILKTNVLAIFHTCKTFCSQIKLNTLTNYFLDILKLMIVCMEQMLVDRFNSLILKLSTWKFFCIKT